MPMRLERDAARVRASIDRPWIERHHTLVSEPEMARQGLARGCEPSRACTRLRAIMNPPLPGTPLDRWSLVVRTITRYRSRLARKLEALRGDLAEAQRAPEYRRPG